MKQAFSSSRVSLLGLAGLAFVGAGCSPVANLQQKVAQKAVENVVENQIKKETGKDVNINVGDNSISVTGENGKSTFTAGEDISLPADFPKDIPLYPNAKIKSAITVEGEDGASTVLESDASAADVDAWYKKEAVAGGWTQEAALDLGKGQFMIAFNRKEGAETYRMTVSISPNDDSGKTNIVVGYGKR